jgi:hypothetical protein
MRENYKKILIKPFLVCFFSILPWYVLAKYILKLGVNVEVYSGIVLVIFFLTLVVINLLAKKAPVKKDVEKTINKFLYFYRNGLLLIVSIQFLIVVLLLLIML